MGYLQERLSPKKPRLWTKKVGPRKDDSPVAAFTRPYVVLSVLHKCSGDSKKRKHSPKSFYEECITLIPKVSKDKAREENDRPI